MKSFSILLITVFAFAFLQQKDSWVIHLDKKIIHRGTENPVKDKIPVVALAKTALKPASVLKIVYKQAPSSIEWKSNFVFTNNRDSTLLQFDFDKASGDFSIPVSAFLTHLKKEKKLMLFADQHPKNDALMIRSKRVLLCNIQLK
jgi:hypothetical protein